MYETIRRVLSHPRAVLWIFVTAALLSATSLPAGLGADDYVHELELSGHNPIAGFQRSPLDIFRFATPDVNASLMNDGVLPWWTDPKVRFAFFRPLSSATHLVDHLVFPGNAFLMHVHTLGWSLLSAGAAWALYRSVLTGWVAPLALALYALDDARGGPVSWVANRSELVACALSVWALVWHRRAVVGEPRFRWLAPLLFGVSLFAGEGSIAITAYLFAHALFLEEGPLARRLAGLAPYAAVTVAWAALYRFLGYGIARSGVYFDPIEDPVGFFRALPERFGMLWLAQLGGPWSEGWNAYPVMFPGVEVIVAIMAVVVIAGAGLLFAPLLREDPRARFFLLGGAISTLPVCGAFPADRLLPWVGVGAMGLIALFFASVVEGTRTGVFARAGALSVVLAHLILAPLLFPVRAAGIAQVRAAIDRGDAGIPHDASISHRTVVYLNPPADPFASYIPITRAARGLPRPKAQRWLATGAGSAVEVSRLDARTLRVRPEKGLLVLPSELLFRNRRRLPFHVGDEVRLDETTLTVTGVTPDGRPGEITARFDEPLESRKYLFMVWTGGTYVPFQLPAVGGGSTIPPVDLVTVAYGPDSPVTRFMRKKGG